MCIYFGAVMVVHFKTLLQLYGWTCGVLKTQQQFSIYQTIVIEFFLEYFMVAGKQGDVD